MWSAGCEGITPPSVRGSPTQATLLLKPQNWLSELHCFPYRPGELGISYWTSRSKVIKKEVPRAVRWISNNFKNTHLLLQQMFIHFFYPKYPLRALYVAGGEEAVPAVTLPRRPTVGIPRQPPGKRVYSSMVKLCCGY